ncbi:hypothetical protein Tel_07130 [Candidatus Tenderia electrophaga]|jgi:hypothetical protein|uniref:Uncharacterized protein n=1 Tax=Candidatus Tenderia electrophaga TaxID=1748243 RepID=A0A0S2TCS1_9GAMM|nr:hypothetical protein Tel_07130 [Candidatus Tenderia electrophaga]
MDTFRITYRFVVGTEAKLFDLDLNADTLLQIEPSYDQWPAWTRLDYHRCPHCPLSGDITPRCPVAANLVPLIQQCGDLESHQLSRIEVETPNRYYAAESSVQRGLSSLLGLVMATSACPDMTFLRPMARFHLPFASDEETAYRAVSSYLLFQYFEAKAGKEADLSLAGLRAIYKRLQTVNRAFAQRLRAACAEDAAVNAIVQLDLFAKDIPYSIDEGLDDLEYLFHAATD